MLNKYPNGTFMLKFLKISEYLLPTLHINLWLIVYDFKGKDFHQEFSNIGQIRSLIPAEVNMMALNATANYTTRMLIIESLEMHSCYEIIHLPNNPNIHYSVLEKPASHMEMLQPLNGLCKD